MAEAGSGFEFDQLPMARDPDCRADGWRVKEWQDRLRNQPPVVSPEDVPTELAAAAGMILLHPDAALRGAGELSDPQLTEQFLKLLRDPDLRQVCRIIISGRKERWDDAICLAIRAAFRRLSDQDRLFNERDKIAIRAASRLMRGDRLVDTEMIREIQRSWLELPEHPLKTRNTPRMRLGDRDISRRQGNTAGYTAVRPRLPTDELTEILPSDWALVRENQIAGLDKIFNRGSLVYSRESPVDRIPQPRVLLAFVINYDRQFQGGAADFPTTGSRLGALAHRMIADVARQAPFDLMTVHVAVYVKDFGATGNARQDGERQAEPAVSATCFNLVKANLGRGDRLVRFDEVVPFYLAHSRLRAVRDHRPQGQWPNLADDPWHFLSSATKSISTYSAVLAVVLSDRTKWGNVLPSREVNLRPMEYGRDAALLIEPVEQTDSPKQVTPRDFRYAAVSNLDAATASGLPKERGTDWEPRNALLGMLLGPILLETESFEWKVVLNV